MAVCVMAFAIATSVTTFQQGFRAIDTARSTTIAGQVLQSMMEDLRLRTWTQIVALHADPANGTPGNAVIDDTFTSAHPNAAAVMSRFTITRTIRDRAGQADMKEILLTATWKGIDGRTHTARYTSFYGKNGLYDYYTS